MQRPLPEGTRAAIPQRGPLRRKTPPSTIGHFAASLLHGCRGFRTRFRGRPLPVGRVCEEFAKFLRAKCRCMGSLRVGCGASDNINASDTTTSAPPVHKWARIQETKGRSWDDQAVATPGTNKCRLPWTPAQKRRCPSSLTKLSCCQFAVAKVTETPLHHDECARYEAHQKMGDFKLTLDGSTRKHKGKARQKNEDGKERRKPSG